MKLCCCTSCVNVQSFSLNGETHIASVPSGNAIKISLINDVLCHPPASHQLLIRIFDPACPIRGLSMVFMDITAIHASL